MNAKNGSKTEAQVDLQLENETDLAHQRVRERLRRWANRLRQSGLEGIADAVLDAAEPLSPLGAQLLWMVQPALGAFLPADEIDGLAHLLNEPGGLAALRASLRMEEQDHTGQDN